MAEVEVAEAARPHLGRADHGRTITDDEFATASYEEPWRYEHVDGRLVVMSPEGTGHVRQSHPWLVRLSVYAFAHPNIVSYVVAQAWIKLGPKNSRIADLGVYLGADPDALDIPHQVPDLVFEFVSPSAADRHRDYVAKRADYQRVGVPEYVIVDRFEPRVTVLTLADGVYTERVLTPSDTYTTPRLPGFAVVLADVLPR